MAVAIRGDTFRHPSVTAYTPEAPYVAEDGSGAPLLEVLGESHFYNPAYDVEPATHELVRLWRLAQGGMGLGLLPEAGGSLDQPAILLAAFDVMTAAERELKGNKA